MNNDHTKEPTKTGRNPARPTVAFVGAGAMAEALLRGMTKADIVSPETVAMLNRSGGNRLTELKNKYGVRIPEANRPEEKEMLIRDADVVVLAVKPKDAGEVLKQLKDVLRPDQLIVSVVAGLTIATMERLIGRAQPIVRTMPNTSSTIGYGATGLACSPAVSPAQRDWAVQMLGAVGIVAVLDENLLDLVTGVSGSGPAYVYYLMEAMIAAGTEGGLSEETAKWLVLQTVLGAARMVELTGENPADLRAKVTSPNGTTFAALNTLDAYRFREGIVQAVRNAAARAGEMGDEIAAGALP